MPSIVYKKSVEGFGISFIEAGSYGKGSIGGIAGGEADAIQDGKTGYLCDGNDLNSIYEAILKFFQNDNYKILGLQAKDFSKNFKWEKIIKHYLSLIWIFLTLCLLYTLMYGFQTKRGLIYSCGYKYVLVLYHLK
jgi:phosphatidylinositol alpha-1,6-mannosyltransferase